MRGVTEGTRIVMVGALMRDIELTLKSRVYRFLQRRWGPDWWDHLPVFVRRSARNRRRWSAEQLGQRRVLGEKDIAWLSMGDVLRVLAEFPPEDWQECLDSETRRRREVDRSLRQIKAYRDYHLAHPKPRRTTLKEQARLCSAVAALPHFLRPNEWSETEALLRKAGALSKEALWDLREELGWSGEAHGARLESWLSCPDLEPPERCKHKRGISRATVGWRMGVLNDCAHFDVGGNVLLTPRTVEGDRWPAGARRRA